MAEDTNYELIMHISPECPITSFIPTGKTVSAPSTDALLKASSAASEQSSSRRWQASIAVDGTCLREVSTVQLL
jgi:hypothetical protein